MHFSVFILKLVPLGSGARRENECGSMRIRYYSPTKKHNLTGVIRRALVGKVGTSQPPLQQQQIVQDLLRVLELGLEEINP